MRRPSLVLSLTERFRGALDWPKNALGPPPGRVWKSHATSSSLVLSSATVWTPCILAFSWARRSISVFIALPPGFKHAQNDLPKIVENYGPLGPAVYLLLVLLLTWVGVLKVLRDK